MERSKHIPCLVLIGCLILIDQVTKALVVRHFALGEILPIIPGFLNLTYIRNDGVAFGMFARGGELTRILLLILPLAVTLGVLLYYYRLPAHQRSRRLAIVLVLAGAISNLIDRFRLGFVVDFLDFHWRSQAHYPSFNAADAFICAGVGLLFLQLRTEEKQARVRNV